MDHQEMSRKTMVSRREILQGLGLVGAGTVLTGCGDAGVKETKDNGNAMSDLAWDKAPCRYCGTGSRGSWDRFGWCWSRFRWWWCWRWQSTILTGTWPRCWES